MKKSKKNSKNFYQGNLQRNVDSKKASFYANTVRYPEVDRKEEPKVIVSNTLQSQIVELHNQFGNTEWSGFLLYSIKEGKYEDPGNMIIVAQEIFPCDVGNSVYTEYDSGDFVVDMDESTDFLMKGWKLGHIHTHHNMDCFFSSTDQSELHSNVGKYKDAFYLSLIVNKTHNVDKYCAKIAKLGTKQVKEPRFKIKGKLFGISKTKEVVAMEQMNCNIVSQLSKGFFDQIKAIKPVKITHSYPNYSKYVINSYNTNWDQIYDDEVDDGGGWSTKETEVPWYPEAPEEALECFYTYWLGNSIKPYNESDDFYYTWSTTNLVKQFICAIDLQKHLDTFEKSFGELYDLNTGYILNYSYTEKDVLDYCLKELEEYYESAIATKTKSICKDLITIVEKLIDEENEAELNKALKAKDKKIIIKDRTNY